MDELTSALTGDPCCESSSPKMCISNEIRDRSIVGQLTEKRIRVAEELAKLDAALDALAADPKLNDALTKIGKAMQVRY